MAAIPVVDRSSVIFESMRAPKNGICRECGVFLSDGRKLLAHADHAFHEDCILRAISSAGNLQCPICTRKVAGISGKSPLAYYLTHSPFPRPPSCGTSSSGSPSCGTASSGSPSSGVASSGSPAGSALSASPALSPQPSFPGHSPAAAAQEAARTLIEAANRGDKECCSQLLDLTNIYPTLPLLPCDIGKALIQAARHGDANIECIQVFLDSGRIPPNAIVEAAIAALRSQGTRSLHLIAMKNIECFNNTVRFVLLHNDIYGLHQLLATGQKMDDANFNQALALVMHNTDTEGFHQLLAARQKMDDMNFNRAVAFSVQSKDFDSLRQLLATGQKLDPEIRGKAIIKLLTDNELLLVECLLRIDEPILPMFFFQIFEQAVKLGHLDFLPLLQTKSGGVKIPDDFLKRMILMSHAQAAALAGKYGKAGAVRYAPQISIFTKVRDWLINDLLTLAGNDPIKYDSHEAWIKANLKH